MGIDPYFLKSGHFGGDFGVKRVILGVFRSFWSFWGFFGHFGHFGHFGAFWSFRAFWRFEGRVTGGWFWSFWAIFRFWGVKRGFLVILAIDTKRSTISLYTCVSLGIL
jgi:hypothetical protein